MLPRVLFVDDEGPLLAAYQRIFQGRYDLVTAQSGPEALALAGRCAPFAAVVADMQMPGMNGIEFLQAFEKLSRETSRIMVTGQANLATAMEAVNLGKVFRFLTKPCGKDSLAAVVEAGIAQYQLVTAEQSLLEQTLTGSIQTLVDMLAVFDPKAFGLSQKVREVALRLAADLELPAPWDLGLAALLVSVGRLAIPLELHGKLERKETLTIKEQEVFRRIPEFGAGMITHIPRLQSAARIILYSGKGFNGEGYPYDGLSGSELPLESRILKVALDFVEQLEVRKSRPVVAAQMKLARGRYDPVVIASLETIVGDGWNGSPGPLRMLLQIEELRVGMVIYADLHAPNGLTLLPAGTRLSGFHLEKLHSLKALNGIEDAVLVTSFEPAAQAPAPA